MENKYFAADTTDALIARCQLEIQNWMTQDSSDNGVFRAARDACIRNTISYYSDTLDKDTWDTALTYGGEQGELVSVGTNKAKTNIKQRNALNTKQRLNFECIVDVTDPEALQTAILGKAITKDVVANHDVEKKLGHCSERTFVNGWHWLSSCWHTDQGYVYRTDEHGMPVYSGGPVLATHHMSDVIFDWSFSNFKDNQWAILKRTKNRWDLITQYKKLETELLTVQNAFGDSQAKAQSGLMPRKQGNDNIFVWEFYHRPTPALPKGRMVVFCDVNCVLYDDINPYECIPLIPMRFELLGDTGIGVPLLSSMLAAQEMRDAAVSAQATNISAFAVQTILAPKGSDISVKDIEGLSMLYYKPSGADGGGKPETLQLCQSPAEVPGFVKQMDQDIDDLSMLTATLRGNPPANVTSGDMAATLSANATEFLDVESKVTIMCVEEWMDLTIKNYQKFATVDQIVTVAGEASMSWAKTFKRENLKSIKHTKVKTQNALMNTVAGRLYFADTLLNGKFPLSPNQYFGIIEGEPIEDLFDDQLTEQMAVKSEISALLEGKNVLPMLLDNHPLFINAYRKVLYNQAVRTNSALYGHITQLIEERMDLEMKIPPAIKAMLRGNPDGQQGNPTGNVPAPSQAMAGQGLGPGNPQNDVSGPAQPAAPQMQ